MYTFEEKGHRHLWNGKRMTGITTVLGVIAKPALISWSANCAVDYILENIKLGTGDTIKENEEMFATARKAHTIKKDKAADIGTMVHKACEEWIKEQKEPELDEQGMKMFNNFKNWALENKVEFIESEKHLWSESMFLAGIVDGIVEIDGQTWIMDIKTSSGIYAEAFYQMAGYQMLWEEMGLERVITGHIVVNLKKDGTFNEKRSISNEDSKEAFLSAYKLYKIAQKVNSQIIN